MLEEVAMQNEELTQQEVPSQEEVTMLYNQIGTLRVIVMPWTIMELCRTLNILES